MTIIGKDMLSVPWLEKLLAVTTFFCACEVHSIIPKNECNKFCLDCKDSGALCGSCVSSDHTDHEVVQIRRSSYNEAVKTAEIYKHIDLLGIQTYVINSSTVVFLNKRSRTQPKKIRIGNKLGFFSDCLCKICERNLVDPCYFCSLACKLEWIKETGGFTLNENEHEKMEKLLEESIKGTPSKEKSKKAREQNLKRKREEGGEEGHREEDENEEEDEEEGDDEEGNSVSPNQASFRKPNSKRKGIPHRAPF